jgi:hypothetical protein
MNYGEPISQKKRGQWTEDQIKLAIYKSRNKEMSVRETAVTFFSSLGDILIKLQEGGMVKMTPGMGWFRRTLTDELGEELVNHMKDLGSRLMPLT